MDDCISNVQLNPPTFDAIIETLTEHMKNLNKMIVFNKQFSEALVLYTSAVSFSFT